MTIKLIILLYSMFMIKHVDFRHVERGIAPYVASFFMRLDSEGVEYDIDGDVVVIFSDIHSEAPGKAAAAHGKNNDKLIFIQIDISAWFILTDIQKEWLVYHELSHDFLNLDHGEAIIMYPVLPINPTLLDLETAKRELINIIK